jgi:hypothetical protein
VIKVNIEITFQEDGSYDIKSAMAAQEVVFWLDYVHSDLLATMREQANAGS